MDTKAHSSSHQTRGRSCSAPPPQRREPPAHSWRGPGHRRSPGSSHMVTTWLEWWEDFHRPRAGRTKGADGESDRKRFWEVEDFFFLVPPFSDVETTQCEEEDGSRQDTRTDWQTGTLSSTRSERDEKQMLRAEEQIHDAWGMEGYSFCSARAERSSDIMSGGGCTIGAILREGEISVTIPRSTETDTGS